MILARRFFMAGSVVLMLSGIGHTLGQFVSTPDPRFAAPFAVMKAADGQMMGMTFSIWGVYQCLGACYAALAFFMGLQNLLTAGALADKPRALVRAATTSGTCTEVMVVVGVAYHLPPAIVLYVPSFLCFAVAAARAD